MEKYYPPAFEGSAFHCPHCGVFSEQHWSKAWVLGIAKEKSFEDMFNGFSAQFNGIKDLNVAFCRHCGNFSIWHQNNMIFPFYGNTPLPEENMPEDVKEDFIEARKIVNASTRGAAALLRLAIQKLMPHLGQSGEDLNDDIGNLVRKGLPVEIQKSLDAVRVIGNHAVHPGLIDIKDDIETTTTLFELVNIIVERMITQPKKINEMYRKIPESKKEAIKKRDKQS